MRTEVEQLAAAIKGPTLDEAEDMPPSFVTQASTPWLPRCAAPDKLYEIYQDPGTTIVAESTRAEALADLEDLILPAGLTVDEFTTCVRDAVARISSFQRFLDKIPAGLTDVQGQEITARLRNELDETDARKHWHIVRESIGVFFQDSFEVATQSYIVRLKPPLTLSDGTTPLAPHRQNGPRSELS